MRLALVPAVACASPPSPPTKADTLATVRAVGSDSLRVGASVYAVHVGMPVSIVGDTAWRQLHRGASHGGGGLLLRGEGDGAGDREQDSESHR